jgi:anti-anti-sigma regulatory factor
MENEGFTVTEEPGGRFVLLGECVVNHCDFFKEVLLDALARHSSVFFDLKGLENVDVTFFQLLYAAGLSAAEAGKTFRCGRNLAEAVRGTAATSGFFDHISLKNIWESEV